jgi:hypothetical protein
MPSRPKSASVVSEFRIQWNIPGTLLRLGGGLRSSSAGGCFLPAAFHEGAGLVHRPLQLCELLGLLRRGRDRFGLLALPAAALPVGDLEEVDDRGREVLQVGPRQVGLFGPVDRGPRWEPRCKVRGLPQTQLAGPNAGQVGLVVPLKVRLQGAVVVPDQRREAG